MQIIDKIRNLIEKLLKRAKLRPVTIAGKCRLQFGLAIVMILALALLMPYFWLDKLTEKSPLDTGEAITDLIISGQITSGNSAKDPSFFDNLMERSSSVEPGEEPAVRWIRFKDGKLDSDAPLTAKEREIVEMLNADKSRAGYSWRESRHGIVSRKYIQVVRANDRCMRNYYLQGNAMPFSPNESIGAILLNLPDNKTSQTKLMNQICIIFAGLLAGAGAIIALYVIIQRTILRPIRLLRALVNNVSEGNLDARVSIKTEDEFQRLSDAFNSMLDGLQESQEKLRNANKQLDDKIVELSQRNIELFKANKLKSEFLANMSHEFRTPLNAILGFADLLGEKAGSDPEKTKRYADNIIKSGRNLLNMINDLLDLAKAQAGKMKLHIEKTSIPELCNSLAVFFSPMTYKKNLNVRVRVTDDIPILMTDAGKVQQILYNFISNAIKFTPEFGSIDISASLLDEKTVRIAISDTGCGIPADQQDSIFQKFRQIDGSITRHGSGTGLGLAICNELAALLAATISLESEEGKGSTFYLDLPILDQVRIDELKVNDSLDE